jgi:hypothetical protein
MKHARFHKDNLNIHQLKLEQSMRIWLWLCYQSLDNETEKLNCGVSVEL